MVDSRRDSMEPNVDSITIEEIPVGAIPNWLFDHFVDQAIDPRPVSKGGPSKVLPNGGPEDSEKNLFRTFLRLSTA